MLQTTGALSDAVLCLGSSPVARSITSYSAHIILPIAAARARADDGETATPPPTPPPEPLTAADKASARRTRCTLTAITYTAADWSTAGTDVSADSIVDSDGDIDTVDLDAISPGTMLTIPQGSDRKSYRQLRDACRRPQKRA